MYFWRVWQWKNSEKNENGEYINNTEYTDYLTAPIFLEDRLDETMDTGEIILKCMPISSKKAFPPKTKFRLERYLTENHTDEPKKWDMVVEHDDVEEYEGCPEICTHRIHLIEASVIAQGMHVDNIALTYELQDVDLNYKVVKDKDDTASKFVDPVNGLNTTPAKKSEITISIDNSDYRSSTTHIGDFINSYKYVWDTSSLGGMKNIKLYHHAVNSSAITFNIPKLFIYGSKDDVNWNEEPLFQLNTATKVTKILKINGKETRTEMKFADGSTTVYSGATSIVDRDDEYCYCKDGEARLRKIQDFEEYKEYSDFKRMYTTFPLVAKADAKYAQQATFYTDVLSYDELEGGYTIDYEITCSADSRFQDGMVAYYKQEYYARYSQALVITNKTGYSRAASLDNETSSRIVAADITIYCYNMADGANAPFIRKGVEYCCYDLLRKALLTCDTYLLDNTKECLDEYGIMPNSDGNLVEVESLKFPIIVSNKIGEAWANRLKVAKMYETVFEQKNLWEILIQIGYYLHAIPYLEFAEDGTDRFVLKFQQLGNTKKNDDENNKITVFNSRNLSEYFTQYDSYVTNLYSPQNVVEEWIVPKTSDSSYLVSNDTAELQTRYNIIEIIDFDIIYDGKQKSALSCLFEQSIYEILTGADPSQIIPAKGNSLYYTLGDNKILGLSYVAVEETKGDKLMSLKYIMQRLFGVNPSMWTQEYTFNDLLFHIKYRTQDSARITQFRPNLMEFMKNSSYEKYPHHEQFYGQQDKIVDSERLSANLFGKLIRVGNAVYQRQECAEAGSEKESGDLVMIDNEPYYVTEAENECYPDATMQKVTYSKNFNQLSQIVTIPSEPRFYEVSERSKVRREVRIQEFFALSTKDTETTQEKNKPVFMAIDKWAKFIEELIFCKERKLPNFAYTKFMADEIRKHARQLTADELFPSCDFVRTGVNTIKPVGSQNYADCIVPLLHFPLHDGIIFEWDMDDNFKAGDYIESKVNGEGTGADTAYKAQQSLRYVDIMGRADLFRFTLFDKDEWTANENPQQLPKAVIKPPADSVIGVQGHEKMSMALDKDNREEISFNYQINLLHSAEEGDDDFITFPNLFGDKTNDLKVCLSSQEQSLFNEDVDLTSAAIIASVPYKFGVSDKGSLTIEFGEPEYIDGADISKVKSVVFYHEDREDGKVAYLVKNVGRLADDEKLQKWYIFPMFNS